MSGGEDEGATQGAWLALVRRARWGNHRLKLAALVVGSYANPDGTGVHCGVARLALDCEIAYSTARKYLAELRRIGLIGRVARVRRRGHSDEYRLILGPDVLEHLDVPDPDTYKRQAREVRATAQRPRTATSCDSRRAAVDNRVDSGCTATPRDSRAQADEPEPVPLSQGEPYAAAYGYADDRVRLSHGIAPTSPTYTSPERTDLPSHEADLRTAAPGPRAREAATNLDSPSDGSTPDRPDPPLRVITGGRTESPPAAAHQQALWPALVREEPPPAMSTAEQAKAQIREILRGHRRAPMTPYGVRPSQPARPRPAGEQAPAADTREGKAS